jgi:serine/threonine protein kinase
MTEQLLDGRYQITHSLAKGGFGQTYLAVDFHRPGHPTCVVKKLDPNTHTPQLQETIQRLFKSEAETLEKLGQNPQIPQLLAYFKNNEEFYLVQEYIPGQSLSLELVAGQPWGTEQVIDLLADILEILDFVHRQGVIHRDIKPDNIIRRHSDQKLVLIDFGSVKELRKVGYSIQQDATIAVGTPAYMPMEQFNGFPQFNSDIYAVGVIGIRAATGLSAEDVRTILNPSRPGAPETYWLEQVSIHPALAAILDKMVYPDYQSRYPTVAAVLTDLQTVFADSAPSLSVREFSDLPHTVSSDTATLPTQISDRPAREPANGTQTVPLLTTTVQEKRHQIIARFLLVGLGSAFVTALFSGVYYRPQLAQVMNLPMPPTIAETQPSRIALAKTLKGHTQSIWSIAVDRKGETLVSSSQDGTIKLWDLITGRLTRSFAAHADTVRSLSLSADGQTLASGNGDNTVKVWNLQTKELQHTLAEHTAPVWSVALSRDGRTLISGSGDRTIKVWDLETGQLVCTLTGHQGKVYAVALSPDEQTVVSGSTDRTIKVWNLRTGQLLRTFQGHGDTVRAIAVSPDGQMLASASWDKTIKLWNLYSGQLLQTLSGHQDRVVTVAFNNHGTTLTSGSLDKTVKLWDVSRGTLRQTLAGHLDWVLAVASSLDGQTFVSSSRDKTIKIWQ